MSKIEFVKSATETLLRPAKNSLSTGARVGGAVLQSANKIIPVEGIVKDARRMANKPGELIKQSTILFFDIGEYTLRAYGKQPLDEKLKIEEPKSRAKVAMKSASKALNRKKPDVDLGIFETLRASVAIGEVGKEDPDVALISAPEIINVVESLPDTEVGALVAERAISEALEAPVSFFNNGSGTSIIDLRAPEAGVSFLK